MTNRIKISRPDEFANLGVEYKVLSNGKESLQLATGEVKYMELGEHTVLQAKGFLMRSKKIIIDNKNITTIGEIKIRADQWYCVAIPILTFLISVGLSSMRLNYPDLPVKSFLNGIGIGALLSVIYLLTLGRDLFLKIEVIQK